MLKNGVTLCLKHGSLTSAKPLHKVRKMSHHLHALQYSFIKSRTALYVIVLNQSLWKRLKKEGNESPGQQLYSMRLEFHGDAMTSPWTRHACNKNREKSKVNYKGIKYGSFSSHQPSGLTNNSLILHLQYCSLQDQV